MPSSTDRKELTQADLARLKQLSSYLRQTDTSYSDRNAFSDVVNLQDLHGNVYQVPSSLVNRENFLDNTAADILTKQDILPLQVADVRFTDGLVTAINTFFNNLAVTFGNLVNSIGTELADNPALLALITLSTLYLAAKYLLHRGYTGVGWSFTKPDHHIRSVKPHGYGGGGHEQKWRRQDDEGQLRGNGEFSDPYAEASNVQQLMHVVDEYKARYGDLDFGVVRNSQMQA